MFQQKPPAAIDAATDKPLEEAKFEMKMEVDQRAEDTGLEKRMTHYEYQHEFNRQVAAEAQVFDKAIKLLLSAATETNASKVNDLILKILKETETPFVYNQTGKSSVVAETIKTIGAI